MGAIGEVLALDEAIPGAGGLFVVVGAVKTAFADGFVVAIEVGAAAAVAG